MNRPPADAALTCSVNAAISVTVLLVVACATLPICLPYDLA
ncbi:hypothetical protein GGR61_001436 [Xanthomonas arboricola]|nr:hypothetical protein [Xanthomonas sp. 3058]